MTFNFPTGKPHISFSEIKIWKECPYRHKLTYIDKIDTFKPSPFLDFGTAVHEGAESFLNEGTVPREKLVNEIREAWLKNGFDKKEWVEKQPGWYKYHPVEEWVNWANNMWDEIPAFLDETFPGWKPVMAEEALYEEIPGFDIKFKGFIDVIIKEPRKNGTWKYWIIDWKTASTRGWSRSKQQDFNMQAQLILYKHFWGEKNKINMRDIGCGFILLKRGGKKGNICSLVKVSAGPATIEKAQKMTRSMIKTVQKKFFLKNRNSCTFCDYKDTEHCPN
jgi:hypothetical protein